MVKMDLFALKHFCFSNAECSFGGKLSTNGEVYSYGVMLLELFTGKSPSDQLSLEG